MNKAQSKWLEAIQKNQLPTFAKHHFGWVDCSCDLEGQPGEDCRHDSAEEKQYQAKQQIAVLLTRSGVSPSHLTMDGPWPHAWIDPDLFTRLKRESGGAVLLFEHGSTYRTYWDDCAICTRLLGQPSIPADAIGIAVNVLYRVERLKVSLVSPAKQRLLF